MPFQNTYFLATIKCHLLPTQKPFFPGHSHFYFYFFFTHCSTVTCALISCNISSLKCETSYSLSETHIFMVWFGSDFMFSLSSFIKKYLHLVSFQDAICNQHSKGYCIISLYIFFFFKLISSITIIQLSLESAWHRPVVKEAIRVKKHCFPQCLM